MVIDHQSGYYGRRNLESNHTELNCQSRFLLAFCHDFYSSVYRQEKLLEIGGGGAIYSLISARLKLDEIIYAENNLWCRNAVRRWLDGERKTHDWTPFFEQVRMLEGNRDPVFKMMDQLRTKLQSVVPCDVLTPRCALARELGERFDIVSSHFCPQGVYDSTAEFELGLSNIGSLVSPGGYLVTSLLEQPAFSSRQDQTPKISAQRMRELLNANKFAIIMERHSGNLVKGMQDSGSDLVCDLVPGQRAAGLMCVAARKCV